MICKSESNREAAFWQWVQVNETRLFEFEKDQERIFDVLEMQLGRSISSQTQQRRI